MIAFSLFTLGIFYRTIYVSGNANAWQCSLCDCVCDSSVYRVVYTLTAACGIDHTPSLVVITA